MLTINSDFNASDCEKLIDKCVNPMKRDAELKLSTNIGMHNKPGGAVYLAQALITWARCYDMTHLVTHAPPLNNVEEISNFSESLHGFVASMMAVRIFAKDRKTSIRQDVYDAARQRVEKMDQGPLSETVKGLGTSLICVDHSSKSYLRPLYYDQEIENRLRGESDFLELTEEILDCSVTQAHRNKISRNTSTALSGILKEIFSNTHDHARHDLDGRRYRKSVRGIHVYFHYLDPSSIAESTLGTPALTTYLDKSIGYWKGKHLQFLELSIFDSGPGLAARALGKQSNACDFSDELAAVNNCFLKHVTTKGRATDGLGLYRTLSLLKNNSGFIRLRSGRVSLCKAFPPLLTQQGDEQLTQKDFSLEDTNGDDSAPSMRSPAEGTSITILLPIGGGSK